MVKLFPFLIVLVLSVFSQTIAGPIQKDTRDSERSDELNQGEDVMSRIAAVNEESDVNLFESDIKLPADDPLLAEMAQNHSVLKRNAHRSRKMLWKNKKVPYTVSQELVNQWYKPTILRAINEFHTKTCIRFVPRTTESNWIEFVKDNGCWSSVGQSYWKTGGQLLSLGNGCNLTATIMHEILHALGFWHEQSRPDRNKFVEILWENIQEVIDAQMTSDRGKDHNFLKYNNFQVDDQSKPYDYQSIMHYGNTYFSKNGLDTIRAIMQPSLELGQRSGFSPLDVDEVNDLYDCNGASSGWSSWSSFAPCDPQCNKRRERFCTSSNPSQDCPGENSYGVQREIVVCGVMECDAPVDGHWGRWSPWAPCSSSCGPGKRSRSRACDDPLPRNNGSTCIGDDSEEKSCVFQSCGLGPYDCEFGNGLCGWIQDSDDEMDWEQIQGPTPSSRTGPAGDYTTGAGHYLYVEASSPARKGHKARIHSQTFQGSNKTVCLIFSYNMYGSGMGTLNVYLNNTARKTLLASKAGNHGNQWHRMHINVHSTTNYQIVVEAVRGVSFRSDIAIDDILFVQGSCSDQPMRNLGCFSDNSRPLDDFYKSFRNEIDWYDLSKTVKQCAKEAKDQGYKVFGVEFYGECWSSTEAKNLYNKDGMSNNCWNGVGKDFAFQAYELL